MITAILAINTGKSKNISPSAAMTTGPSIPADDLFIPGEPDFIPDYILGKEKRSFWSVEDLKPYWKTPGNHEFWRSEIKSEMDKLLEGVP
jgi:hypothetical protein